jgi:hypothetical protein
MLTGSPVVEVPSRQVFFGNTVVSGAANLSLSYSMSARASLTIFGGLARSQPVSSGRERGPVNRLLGHSTSVGGGASLSYALSPRTQGGVTIDEYRTISPIQDVYQTSATGFIGRKMSRQWFAQLYAGGASMRPVRGGFQLPSGLQYQGGGSVGFRTYSHTLLFSSGRAVGDRYGIGAGSTINATGAWNWAHPRRSWTMSANVSEQWFRRGAFGNFPSWQVSAGVVKALTRNLSVSGDYVYATTGQSQVTRHFSQRGGRVSLIWTPQSHFGGR